MACDLCGSLQRGSVSISRSLGAMLCHSLPQESLALGEKLRVARESP